MLLDNQRLIFMWIDVSYETKTYAECYEEYIESGYTNVELTACENIFTNFMTLEHF